MKVSTKGRYALRLMVDLGVNGGEDKYISLKDISARQNISIKYLEQIVTPLHRAGLVRSVRGAQGGYRLSRKADKYTAGEILSKIMIPLSNRQLLIRHLIIISKKKSRTRTSIRRIKTNTKLYPLMV